MTLDVAIPTQTHPIAGAGPYGVPWPYELGTIVPAIACENGTVIPLTSDQYSVLPEQSPSGGNVFLAPDIAAPNAGQKLFIERRTPDEQGWQGTQSARERGLEAQLDQMQMGQQEVRGGLGRTLRGVDPVPPFRPGADGSAPLWLNGTLAGGGPDAASIAQAAANGDRAEAAAAASIAAAAERFPSRAVLAAWIADGNVPVNGRTYSAEGLFYKGVTGSTSIVDLPGLVPAGISQPAHYGIFGSGSYTAVKNKALRDFAVGEATGHHFAQSGAIINRLSDRLFIGGAVELDGAWPPVDQDWLTQYQRTHALKLAVGVPGSGVTTLGSPVITFAAGGITPPVGAVLTASRGVPVGAQVLAVNSSTQITLNVNATATTTGNIFFSQNGTTAGGIGNSAALFSLTGVAKDSATPAVFGARSKNFNANGTSCIGVSAFAINDNATFSTRAWAGYFEAHRVNGSVTGTVGIEIDVSSWAPAETNPTPFAQGQTNGMLIGAGCGLDAAGQSNISAGIYFVANPTRFRKGIVFAGDSIEGTDGLTGAGVAIAMANGHQVSWYNDAGAVTGRVSALAGLTAAQLSEMRFNGGGVQFLGATGQQMMMLQQVANSVNYPIVSGGIAGGSVTINANGADATVDLRLTMKGGGYLRYGTFAASADVPITGYITIKDDTGTLRKLAVVA